MENIDDIDYRHGNNMFKKFKLKSKKNKCKIGIFN